MQVSEKVCWMYFGHGELKDDMWGIFVDISVHTVMLGQWEGKEDKWDTDEDKSWETSALKDRLEKWKTDIESENECA